MELEPEKQFPLLAYKSRESAEVLERLIDLQSPSYFLWQRASPFLQ
jgi:hypothetical protein